MEWLKRWNFIERARYERQLLDAYGRGENIEALAQACEPGFQKEVWEAMAPRIRKMEQMMRDKQPPKQN
ncbi:MAG: hypothetical protein VKJ87_04720 [Synechococcus sp.]|nr:hypothetical protein [Synechococcus sp.]